MMATNNFFIPYTFNFIESTANHATIKKNNSISLTVSATVES